MYKHILIATDGSELAEKAIKTGLSLAKALGARATAVTVTEPWTSFVTWRGDRRFSRRRIRKVCGRWGCKNPGSGHQRRQAVGYNMCHDPHQRTVSS
jgi:universal stress protein family protein